MGEALRDDLPLGLALQAVVADRRRGAQPLLDVAGLEQVALGAGVVAPDPG